MGTIQTLRPNGNALGASDWTATGAGTLYGALSDSSDASTVKKNAVAGQRSLKQELGTYTIPGTSRVKRFRAGIRVLAPAGCKYGVQVRTTVAAADNTTGHLVWVERALIDKVSTASSGSATTRYSTWVSDTELAQSMVDDLRASAVEYRDGSARSTFYEMFVELDVVDQPTVTVDAVATNTTSPSVSWVYTDGDGDPQSHVHVKVFDSATYGAGGFDPGTSAAVWDSGVTAVGPGTASMPTTSPLSNGVAYRAYVRVGHDAGPVIGTYWSAWAYAGWTVAINPPATPSLTAAYLPASNAVAITVAGHTNQLSTDDAQADTTVGNWTGLTNIAATWPQRSTAYASEGSASVEMKAAAGGTMAVIVGAAGRVTVEPGYTYSVIADIRAPAAGTARSVRVGIRWLNSGGGTISDVYGTAANDSTSAFTTYSYVAVAPTGAATAAPIVEVASAAINELHYVDKAALYPGVAVSSTNLLSGEDATFAAGSGAKMSAAFSTATIAYSVVRAQSDTRSILVTAGAGSNIAAWNLTGLAVGGVYTLSGYVWAAPGSGDPTIVAGIFGGTSGSVAASGLVLTTSTKSAWVRLGVTFTADTSGNIAVGLQFPSGNAGAQWWTDSWQLELGATPAAFAPPTAAWSAGGYTAHRGIVERSDDAGATWLRVRGPTGMDAKQVLLLTDHEAPRGGSVMYRVHTEGDLAGLTNASAFPATQTVTVTNDGTFWVKAVADPALNLGGARVQADPVRPVEEAAGVFRPLGATEAVVVAGDLYGQDWAFEIVGVGATEMAAVEALLTHQGPLLAQSPMAEPDRYLRVVERSVTVAGTPAAPWSRWQVDSVEVSRPAVT